MQMLYHGKVVKEQSPEVSLGKINSTKCLPMKQTEEMDVSAHIFLDLSVL